MRYLIQMMLSFFGRHFINFLLILLILVAGTLLFREYNKYEGLYNEFQLAKDVPALRGNVEARLEEYNEIHKEFSKLIENTDDNELKELIPKIQEKTKKIKERKAELEKIQEEEGTFEENKKIPWKIDKLPECLLRDLELDLISGLLQYFDNALDLIKNKDSYSKKLKFYYKQYSITLEEHTKTKAEHGELVEHSPTGGCFGLIIPSQRSRCYELEDKLKVLQENLDYILEQIETLQSKLSILKNPTYKAHYKNKPYYKWLGEMHAKYESAKKEFEGYWLYDIIHETKETLPKAFAILLGVILTPVFIKAIFYFVLSPIASLLKPVKIVPDESGELTLAESKGSVSADVLIDKDHELLVHSDYLQSSSIHGEKGTSWFLNKKYPFTCLAAQMVALTRIRTDKEEVFVVSANEDASSEIGVISVPSGASVVLQPHNLVGVVQSIGSKVRITSHWRFASLHAWLTLQLRYLAIHGPCKLVVQGCRGVRCEPAGDGRSINQASTIGFSAGLDYSTRRCDTFVAYLLGKRELLNDTFKGKGYCIYQETPASKKGSMLFGRGLQGFVDSLLKVFGV